MDVYKRKYIIGEVLDNDTQERSEEYSYRIGRECYLIQIEEGKSLIVEYSNGRRLTTSCVIDIDQTDYGFWVVTRNRTYRFDTEGFYK